MGQSELGEDEFLRVLSDWTSGVTQTLPADSRRLFEFLCCLEEPDRTSEIVIANWDDFLERLRRPDQAERRSGSTSDPDTNPETTIDASIADAGTAQSLVRPTIEQTWSALQPLLVPLLRAGLVELTSAESGSSQLGMHPGVAEAGRRAAGNAVQSAVDAELAAYWTQSFWHGWRQMEAGQGGGGLARTSGLRVAPYLLRRADWKTAATLLERVIGLDQSAATVSTVLPLLRRIAAVTAGTELGLAIRGVLANALLAARRWQDAETEHRAIADDAEQQQTWRLASVALGSVVNIMLQTGRAESALALVERKKRATTAAGLGPWTRLLDETYRLQLLNELGRYAEVLAEVTRLREVGWVSNPSPSTPEARGDAEPSATDGLETHPTEEAVNPWNVRETLLDTGHTAALQTEDWALCLELNAAILASKKERHASELEQARTRFNVYGPLLSLNRLDEARRLLLDGLQVFESHNGYAELGRVLSALADLESRLGHPDRAVDAEHSALRYTYLAAAPGDCAISHFNLANYLQSVRAAIGDADAGIVARLRPGESAPHGRDVRATASLDETTLAHRLAALCIFLQTGDGRLPSGIAALAGHLSQVAGSRAELVLASGDGSGFDSVVAIVEQVEGVHFRELFERLPARAASGPEALAQILALARQQPDEPDADADFEQFFRSLVEPLAAAAAQGADLEPLLAELREQLTAASPDADPEQLDALLDAVHQAALAAAQDAGPSDSND